MPGFLTIRGRALLRAALVLGAGLAAAAAAVSCYEVSAFQGLELGTVDTRFSVRGHQHPAQNLVVVQVDDATFQDLGLRWPFPRSLHAQVIRAISGDRPEVIAYDVQFTEPTTPREDNALIEAVAASGGRTVLATPDVDAHGRTNVFGGGDLLRRIHAHVGNSGFPVDPGDVLRRIQYKVNGLKAFAIVAAETATGRTIKGAALGGTTAWIDFYGPPGTIPAVSFSRVLRHQVRPGFFAGKVVVVGVSAPSEQDLHATSVAPDDLMSGPEVEANAIATALRGFPLKSTPRSLGLELVLLMSLLLPLAHLRIRLRWTFVLGIVAAAGYAVATQLAFNEGWIVPFLYPLGGLAASAIALLGARSGLATAEARAASLDGSRELAPGVELGGYRVERLLGRGGGGSVYLAHDDALRRRVALKVLNLELAEDVAFHRRFLNECQLAAALDHAHVVPIYRAAEDAGRLFIAMKLVRGSLAGLLRRDGRLELPRALAIVEQLAGALDAAHGIGLVHRDVSPSNVLLDPPGALGAGDHAYLADFGLMVQHDLTSATGRVGKPDYVAPEQIRGEDVDARADQYALGCVFYECLTGEAPFAGISEISVIGGHLSRKPPSVMVCRPDLPKALDDVVARVLAKLPEERYLACGEFVAAARRAAAPRRRRAPTASD